MIIKNRLDGQERIIICSKIASQPALTSAGASQQLLKLELWSETSSGCFVADSDIADLLTTYPILSKDDVLTALEYLTQLIDEEQVIFRD